MVWRCFSVVLAEGDEEDGEERRKISILDLSSAWLTTPKYVLPSFGLVYLSSPSGWKVLSEGNPELLTSRTSNVSVDGV